MVPVAPFILPAMPCGDGTLLPARIVPGFTIRVPDPRHAHERPQTLQATCADGCMALLCEGCYGTLRNGNVPCASLVYVDPGPLPSFLPPLTLMERTIVSALRPCRYVMFCRPPDAKAYRDNDTFHMGLKGHVVAFANPSPATMARTFPMPLADIPEVMKVVLLVPAKSRSEVHRAVKRVRALQVQLECCAYAQRLMHCAPSITLPKVSFMSATLLGIIAERELFVIGERQAHCLVGALAGARLRQQYQRR